MKISDVLMVHANDPVEAIKIGCGDRSADAVQVVASFVCVLAHPAVRGLAFVGGDDARGVTANPIREACPVDAILKYSLCRGRTTDVAEAYEENRSHGGSLYGNQFDWKYIFVV